MHTSTKLLLPLAAACLLSGVGPLSAQQPDPALVGSVSFDAPRGRLNRIIISVGDGGSGPYPAVLVGDTSLSTHTIYRPRDLTPFGSSNRLPIVAWGNGSCRNNSGEYRNFLTEIASHGFLVVAIGPAVNSLVLDNAEPGGGTQPSQLLDGVEWAVGQNGKQESEYFQKIDGSKVAVMGHSCDGTQSLNVSHDPRVTTTVVWNSGVRTTPAAAPSPAATPSPAAMPSPAAAPAPPTAPVMTKERLSEIHSPVAYFTGGPRDQAYANGVDDFERINHVPIFFGSQDVGHYPATFRQEHGGAFGKAAVAWLKWHLKDDVAASREFVGSDCGLCRDPAWTVRSKNIR